MEVFGRYLARTREWKKKSHPSDVSTWEAAAAVSRLVSIGIVFAYLAQAVCFLPFRLLNLKMKGTILMSATTELSFPPMAEKYFVSWFDSETWYKGNLSDRQGFYRFAKSALKCPPQDRPTAKQVRTRIVQDGHLDAEYLERVASQFADLYVDLLDFVATPFIDETD